MRKIIFLLMACLFAFASNITFGTDAKHQLTEQMVVVDSVKGLGINKVKTILQDLGFKREGTITRKKRRESSSYGFFLKFLNLNKSKDAVKSSYDFGDYSVSWENDFVIVIVENETKYIINFE